MIFFGSQILIKYILLFCIWIMELIILSKINKMEKKEKDFCLNENIKPNLKIVIIIISVYFVLMSMELCIEHLMSDSGRGPKINFIVQVINTIEIVFNILIFVYFPRKLDYAFEEKNLIGIHKTVLSFSIIIFIFFFIFFVYFFISFIYKLNFEDIYFLFLNIRAILLFINWILILELIFIIDKNISEHDNNRNNLIRVIIIDSIYFLVLNIGFLSYTCEKEDFKTYIVNFLYMSFLIEISFNILLLVFLSNNNFYKRDYYYQKIGNLTSTNNYQEYEEFFTELEQNIKNNQINKVILSFSIISFIISLLNIIFYFYNICKKKNIKIFFINLIS